VNLAELLEASYSLEYLTDADQDIFIHFHDQLAITPVHHKYMTYENETNASQYL
jgi:hypothetical protein